MKEIETDIQYGKTYTLDELSAIGQVTTRQVITQREYTICDTPEIEYWLLKKADGYYLNYTWGHFTIRRGKKVRKEVL